MRLLVLRASIVITAMVASSAVAAPSCPINYGPHADAKPNKLYLYFPTADDPTFRNVDPPASLGLPPFITSSSPLHRFDTADLPDYHGTVTELRNAISDVVADIYCEFNVQVIQTTTVPPSTEPRRNTVGIGTACQRGINVRRRLPRAMVDRASSDNRRRYRGYASGGLRARLGRDLSDLCRPVLRRGAKRQRLDR